MPIEVDVQARLLAIAEATVAVAEQHGVDAISYRTVARRLGGSTTRVSNYLPTRSALLNNALAHARRLWVAESVPLVAEAPRGEKLRALVRWCCSTGGPDLVLRRMLIYAVAEKAAGETLQAFGELARADRQELVDAAIADGYRDPEPLADALFLLCRGFYFATVENRDAWPDARAGTAVDALFDAVVGQGPD